MSNIKLIMFADDTYGIRKGNWLIGYKYFDFVTPKHWWRKSSEYFFGCCITDKETALKYYSKFDEEVV